MTLTAYLKPTNFCNVGCEHCYLPESVRADKAKMGDTKMREVANFLLCIARAEGHNSLHVIWHGGEPMMLSPEYYENALSIFDDVVGASRFTTSFQTSLIPYRHEWAPLVHSRFHSQLGSSIDFSQRKVKSSPQHYLDLWMKKVRMARFDGIYILPGMVPTRREVGRGAEIVQWFVDHDFAEFNIERYSRYGDDISDWPSNSEHSDFLVEVFDAIVARLEHGLSAPYVSAISAGIRGVLFGVPGDRWGGQCQKQFLVIEPDGSLNSCPDRAKHEAPFANTSAGAEGLISSSARRNWIRIQNVTHKKPHCYSCEFNHWCKSGCPVTPNGPADGETECSGYKSFLLHVLRYAEQSPEHRERLISYATPPGEPITAKEALV